MNGNSFTLRILLFLVWFGISTCATLVDLLDGTENYSIDGKLKFRWTRRYPEFQYFGKSSLMSCQLSIMGDANEYDALITISKDIHGSGWNTLEIEDHHRSIQGSHLCVKLQAEWIDHTQLPTS
ncbi:uncharacterized protein MELLADRAFT_124582 [Melampsora larici-populina 98AG31]|uniref:Secreted protein n=1 Tax=Melampsora larici-populina (strain 98AG31 / pathotype 3-4-7) TaxID=747676 RepID=F4REF9_MELLP|nr:uncharacterized protein MELLADRAFT_124582 [Melampsora larici-populina 98AG31]EGG09277.1 secreted protein [Melampsora larici-populina 98AG31]